LFSYFGEFATTKSFLERLTDLFDFTTISSIDSQNSSSLDEEESGFQVSYLLFTFFYGHTHHGEKSFALLFWLLPLRCYLLGKIVLQG